MPIEIRELIIRARVSSPAPETPPIEPLLERLKQDILHECARQIRERMRETPER